MSRVRMTDGVVLSHPRCGHGEASLEQFEDGALLPASRRQALPAGHLERVAVLNELREEAAALAGSENSWVEVWGPPCSSCIRAGYGRRELRAEEIVSSEKTWARARRTP